MNAQPKTRTWPRWAEIPGFPAYRVSDHGKVRNLLRDRELKGFTKSSGHRWVALHSDGKRKSFAVHALVLTAFGPERPEGATLVRHHNDKPADNRIENLSWGNSKSNAEDAKRNGRTLKGKPNPRKLNMEVARELRRRHADGESIEALARELGVHARTVSRAVSKRSKKKTWQEASA